MRACVRTRAYLTFIHHSQNYFSCARYTRAECFFSHRDPLLFSSSLSSLSSFLPLVEHTVGACYSQNTTKKAKGIIQYVNKLTFSAERTRDSRDKAVKRKVRPRAQYHAIRWVRKKIDRKSDSLFMFNVYLRICGEPYNLVTQNILAAFDDASEMREVEKLPVPRSPLNALAIHSDTFARGIIRI